MKNKFYTENREWTKEVNVDGNEKVYAHENAGNPYLVIKTISLIVY